MPFLFENCNDAARFAFHVGKFFPSVRIDFGPTVDKQPGINIVLSGEISPQDGDSLLFAAHSLRKSGGNVYLGALEKDFQSKVKEDSMGGFVLRRILSDPFHNYGTDHGYWFRIKNQTMTKDFQEAVASARINAKVGFRDYTLVEIAQGFSNEIKWKPYFRVVSEESERFVSQLGVY